MNKKGFTLVELVVAIAALALCSGFILSMYFKSDELSDDANLYDEAMNQVSFIVETFKASDSPINFAKNIHLDMENGEGKYVWNIYYNENWYVKESQENAYVMLKLELTPEVVYESGSLYSLDLDFYKNNTDSLDKVISISSKKYYPGGAR